MEYRELANTGIQISRIGFGAQRFEHPHDRDACVETVLHAYNNGINFFDTAMLYCADQSEFILGDAIQEMKKGELPFHISSKCYYGDSGNFREKLETSLQRLGLQQIDFFTNLWGVKSYGDWLECVRFGAVDQMVRAREEGLIKHVSITTHMPSEDLRKVLSEYGFDINIVGYNVLNAPWRTEGMRASHGLGVGNIAMNPLGTGIIPQYEHVFNAICIRDHQSIVEGAIHYMLSSPYVDSVLVGLRNKSDVQDALDSFASFKPYTEEERQLVHTRLKRRIAELDYDTRHKIAMDICQKMYINREEVAALMDVYVLSIWRN
ncbi:aldo/keto reductase [Paenibacillus thalictri]|uniref:Aldo/keto reductase n=1 Tax=Paenibacillus thalictri TaxID=2527873 RepID=A0A4Q9DV11_9BACL|nr:aldo/keto reductase [Paenibacillus thalictri]TBL80104.1 aldo/keto reductase [Paenibacillus thalictri]